MKYNLPFVWFVANPKKQFLKDGHNTIKLTDEDLKDFALDIEEGHVILKGIRACEFVRQLLNQPGVRESIAEVGGWTKVIYFAKMCVECELENDTLDEKHFMP